MNLNALALSTQPAEHERRGYRRLAAGMHVRYHQVPLRRREREYLKAVAEDVSLGGMFLSSHNTFPAGTTIDLEFSPPEEGGAPVRAKAVVCWRRRWREPRGMGVRFVEFYSLGARRLNEWIETVLATESITA
jgi:c-di-GMP-binding flagellar brake protein YcgR